MVLFAFFIIFALLLGGLIRTSLRRTNIPYSVLLLLIGVALGLAARYSLFQGAMVTDIDAITFRPDPDLHPIQATLHLGLLELTSLDPHLLLFMFLPVLIFESAFSMEIHLFRRSFGQIAILAIPALFVASITTAVVSYFLLPWDWDWIYCLLFGALISATDPVAVVALLKEVCSRKRLETLIEGESLLNDGTAIVLFSIFMAMAVGEQNEGLLAGGLEFIRVVIGGVAVGALLAGLALFWFERIYNDPLVEISITVALSYLVYALAEGLLHVSGVVALVTMALIFAGPGRTRISVDVIEFLHHFWEMMAHMANTLIFVLVGLIVALRVRLDQPEWWLMLILLYLAITLIRAASVGLFMPLLKQLGFGLTRPKAAVLVWGGLRGAVALALSLLVANHPVIPDSIGEQILFLTAGIVVLTISINGTSMSWLLDRLGLKELPPAKMATQHKARSRIAQELRDQILFMRQDPLLKRVDWLKLVPLVESTRDNQTVAAVEETELTKACYRQILESERRHYWQLYRHGAIGRQATARLIEAVEKALDDEPDIGMRISLERYWRSPRIMKLAEHWGPLNKLFLSLTYQKMALGYEVAWGYVSAQQAIEKNAFKLISDYELAKQVKSQSEQNSEQVLEMVNQLQQSFPEIAYSLETHTAQRLLLNREKAVIAQLQEDAQIETTEARKMTNDVQIRLKALRNLPKFISPSDHLVYLGKVEWLSELDDKYLQRLAKVAQRRFHSSGEQLMKHDQKVHAIAILCRGEVKQQDTTHNKPGTTLGLTAIMTGHVTHDIETSGHCDLIWLPLEVIRDCIATDPQLMHRLTEEIDQDID